MKTRIRRAVGVGLAASLLACSAASWAVQSGKTTQGWPYQAGGVSLEERNALFEQGRNHSL